MCSSDLEQGDQVIKSPWTSWQFEDDYDEDEEEYDEFEDEYEREDDTENLEEKEQQTIYDMAIDSYDEDEE